MKNVLKTILYIIGFPVLIALVVYNSLVIYQEGGTYGFWPFIGLIIACVCLIAYTVVFIVTGKNSKKNKGNHKKVMRSVATLVVMAFVLTAGIWLVVDIPLPGILKNATDGTRLFKHMEEDYKAQAEVHGNLLENYIRMNVKNGNLSTDVHSEEEWVKLGYKSPEVKELLANNFKSMDTNGYKSFTTNGPWLNMANNSRLTIPVLVHLVLNERDVRDETITYHLEATLEPKEIVKDIDGDEVYKKPVQNEEVETVIRWTILDMQGTAMTINLDSVGDMKVLNVSLKDLIGVVLNDAVCSVLGTVNEAIADPALAGSELYVGLDLRDGGFKLMLTPAAESRGMHGYQNSAWLNSNNLLFAVISIFPARQWLYIWGAVVIFSSVAVAALRVSQYGGKKEEEVVVVVEDEPIDTNGMNNYEKAVVTALSARNRMK